MKKKRLVTSALPYVNNIPHLGNLIQVLSADVFARFCRLKGYETLYICGTDEYGTATETRALEEGISPKELCDRYNKIHREIYNWFNIQFDHFGRTSSDKQSEIVQSLFKKVEAAGFIHEKQLEQLYCPGCERFLADRYIRGTCPHCGFEEARGDQCEDCGKLLEPTELINPRCHLCQNTPELRKTKHLYLDLPGILPQLKQWMDKASVNGFWAKNAIKMTEAWIRDGLKERCITRDLKWGIPVPREGYEGKVFYVWFDAPIGYISITASHTDKWEDWWKKPKEVELFQFIGKDNIPFHTVIFPGCQLASGENWTMLHHMSSSEYLNYEQGKFSKSKGCGVFGNDVQDTGIPADVWRFYIFFNRPERSDYQFTWDDFQKTTNQHLIGNFGNLANRSLTFINKYFEGLLPEGKRDETFWQEITALEEKACAHLERAELKDALHTILEISDKGNMAFQQGEPWKTRNTDPQAASDLLFNLAYLLRDLSLLLKPYIPASCEKLAEMLGSSQANWDALGKTEGISQLKKPQVLFKRLEDDQIKELRERYKGSQQERKMQEKEKESQAVQSDSERFMNEIELRVGKIINIERHPEADKLYVETVDMGDHERTIVSGLVPHYKEEELLEKKVIIVANLKAAKLRGVKSEGMLLAADDGEQVEVLFVNDCACGSRVILEGQEAEKLPEKKLKIDKFFEVSIQVDDFQVKVDDRPLFCEKGAIKTKKVKAGKVG